VGTVEEEVAKGFAEAAVVEAVEEPKAPNWKGAPAAVVVPVLAGGESVPNVTPRDAADGVFSSTVGESKRR
jgi:hypothetical protein